ncbi:MAG: ribonuclease HI [Chitinispirillales bacterium]|nr:ribonuclease HI [Chitinispirillales bacterium]
MKKVNIYTDGACSGNPGPGGYAAILRYKGTEKILSGGYSHTTNNRMELVSVIVALESLKECCEVVVMTDSQYVVNAIEKEWVYRWKAAGWMRNKKEKAQNSDLWERLLEAIDRHQVTFQWVRGHSGHPENERCDAIAVEESRKRNLPIDTRLGLR